jgi:hypothetical protein
MGDGTPLSVARRQVTPAPTSAACAPGAAAALQFGTVQGLMIVGSSFKIERLQSGEVSARQDAHHTRPHPPVADRFESA